jgi:hypothetical protein
MPRFSRRLRVGRTGSSAVISLQVKKHRYAVAFREPWKPDAPPSHPSPSGYRSSRSQGVAAPDSVLELQTVGRSFTLADLYHGIL